MHKLPVKSFSKHVGDLEKRPYLGEIQNNSWEWFVKHGIKELFKEVSPIKDYTGKEYELYFEEYAFDEPKFSIFSNIISFNWDLPRMEREKQVVFIEYPHKELESFIEQENQILELIDTLGVERIVFDSINPLANLVDRDMQRPHLQKIVNIIRKWGATTIITADDMVPPDPNVPRTSCGIESLTDGYIHLGWIRNKMQRQRTLEVVKLRGAAHMQDVHSCNIDSKGFSVLSQNNKTNSPPVPPLTAHQEHWAD